MRGKKGNTKITLETVKAIKQGLRDGTQGNILATLHSVSEAHISRIKNGSRWPEVS